MIVLGSGLTIEVVARCSDRLRLFLSHTIFIKHTQNTYTTTSKQDFLFIYLDFEGTEHGRKLKYHPRDPFMNASPCLNFMV